MWLNVWWTYRVVLASREWIFLILQEKKSQACFIYVYFNLFQLRTQAEMGHTCRGTINLATANIVVEDSCNFVISNGGAQTYHLKANSEVERQRWITALELAKAKAVHMQAESGKKEKHNSECRDKWLICVSTCHASRILYLSLLIFFFFICSIYQMTQVTIVHRCLPPQDRAEAAATLKSSPRYAL